MNDQRSLTDQLADLHGVAVQQGMYDAADFLAETVRARRSHPSFAPIPLESDITFIDTYRGSHS